MGELPPDDLDDEDTHEEKPVLSPEDLDISNSEYVEELEEGRYVVSPHKRVSEPDPSPPQPSDDDADPDQAIPPERTSPNHSQAQSDSHQSSSESLTQREVHDWLRRDFERNNSRYAFDVTATFDGTVSQRRMASNDVVTIFESLMLWYAQQVDNDTPVEEILGILLMESNVPVRYPPKSVRNLVKSTGLGPDDTIADLLRAVQEDDGLQL